MSENLNRKLQKLDNKVERLKKERNKLLESNTKLVQLFKDMESFLEHELRIGEIDKSKLAGNDSLPASEKLNIQDIQSQIEEIEEEISRLDT